MTAQLKLVQPEATTSETLRQLFLERDRTVARLVAIDATLSAQASVYAASQGMLAKPRLERIRREVGA